MKKLEKCNNDELPWQNVTFPLVSEDVNQNEKKNKRNHNKGVLGRIDSFYYRTKSRKIMRIIAEVFKNI